MEFEQFMYRRFLLTKSCLIQKPNLLFEVLGSTLGSGFLVLWHSSGRFWCSFLGRGGRLLFRGSSFLLLLLGGSNGQVSLGFPDFRFNGLLSLDLGPRLSADTSLGFQRSSVPLSGLDFSHGTFLVLSSVEDGPGDLSRILLGLELLLRFTVDQDDSFTVGLDVQDGFLRMSDLWGGN